MREIHLRQLRFIYSACGPFTKNKIGIQKLKAIGDSKYIYKNELDKACFQLNMAYRDFKDLPRRKESDKVLHNKAFEVASNLKYGEYQRGPASMVHKCSDRNAGDTITHIGGGIISEDQQLAKYTYQPLENFKGASYVHLFVIAFDVLILQSSN